MSPERDFDQDGLSSDQVLLKSDFDIIYIMLLSDLEKLLSVWENVLSIANVT